METLTKSNGIKLKVLSKVGELERLSDEELRIETDRIRRLITEASEDWEMLLVSTLMNKLTWMEDEAARRKK